MKPIRNKWQWWCKPFGRDFYHAGSGYGWHIFEFGIIKINLLPEQGNTISPRNYKGFIVRFAYWLPIDRV